MKVRQLASNMTELAINSVGTILFSYETPVAALTPEGSIRTNKHWSATTSRHISKWIASRGLVKENFKEVDQEVLYSLVGGK